MTQTGGAHASATVHFWQIGWFRFRHLAPYNTKMAPAISPGLTRREFLAATNAAAFLLLLESCSVGPIGRSAASPSIPAGASAFEQALLLMRDAVRASPDHLAERATDLVAGRDATKIVEFVRDRIAAIPPFFQFEEVRSARRWGTAATLRGGQGTLRERSDILADMLTRAGFKAQVMAADLPPAIGLAELYRARSSQFAPDKARLDAATRLIRGAGLTVGSQPPKFDPGPDPVAAISSALPDSLQQAALRQDLLPPKVPVVEFDQGGQKRYAFALGDLGVAEAVPSGLATYGDGDPMRMMSFTVSAMSNSAPGSSTVRGRMVDLVSARWPIDAVIGRQLLLTFLPPQGPKAIIESGLDVLPVRLPTLRLQTDQLPASAPSDFTVVGPAITMQGDVLVPAAGATPAANGGIDGPFGTIPSLSDADLKQAVARAATIKASANATAFPDVELDFTVTDASGAGVDGLSAASFTVKEGGQAVPGFALYSNVKAQQRPRVLIVYDASINIGGWSSAAAENTFRTKLGSAVVNLAASQAFDVQVVGAGAAPDPAAWVAPQAAAIVSAMKTTSESADDPWLSAGGAALDQGVSAIICVSDFQTTDVSPTTLPTLQRRVVASRVPVFAVPVGPAIDHKAAAQVVSMSGGVQMNVADSATPTKIAALVAPLVAGWVGGAYRIRYAAPAGGPSSRTVTIGIAGRDQPVANPTYQVPTSPVPGPSFTGLYVTIEIPGLFRSFRRLAGIEADPGGAPLGVIDDPSDVAATKAAMNGVTTIAIEPGTPTAAAVLDDAVSALLSSEPLRPLKVTASADEILSAAKAGLRRFPTPLVSMLLPQPTDPGALQSLTVAILQERALTPLAIETHADFAIGANLVIPIATDRHAGFKAALTTSLGASAAEAAMFDDSAYRRLSGHALHTLATFDYPAYNEFFSTVPSNKVGLWKAMTRIYGDHHMLVSAAGAVDAFWVVDPTTGAAKAVMLDGTGGGFIRTACKFDGEFAMSITLAYLSIMCAGAGVPYSYYCVGINVSATGMCVVQIFEGKATLPATPLGLWIGFFNPYPNSIPFNAAVGVVLLLLTLSDACD